MERDRLGGRVPSAMPPQLIVRAYQSGDKAQVLRLDRDSLQPGNAAVDDRDDLYDIERHYFTDPANHFWVALVRQRIVGMIAVRRQTQPHVAELRRLRVTDAWHNSCVPDKLIQTALQHCRRQGFLKVIVDTHYPVSAAVKILTRHGFQHTRSRCTVGKHTLEFYLNLYRRTDETGADAAWR